MKFQTIFLTAIASLLSIYQSISQIVPLAKTIDTTYHSVVAILRVDSTGKPIMAGSGVLIHPNVILTAGHNNFSNVTTWWDKNCSPIGFISFGNNALKSNDRIPFNWVKDIETHPDWYEILKSYSDTTRKSRPPELTDIGLIFLDQPVLNKPLIRLPEHNTLITIDEKNLLIGVGYGYHWMDTVTNRIPGLVDGLRRKWKLHQLFLDNEFWLSTNCDSTSTLPYVGMFDSGAPLLLNDTIVVGIWSGGHEAPKPYLYSSDAARIDNSRILKWIQDKIKTRLGPEIK